MFGSQVDDQSSIIYRTINKTEQALVVYVQRSMHESIYEPTFIIPCVRNSMVFFTTVSQFSLATLITRPSWKAKCIVQWYSGTVVNHEHNE